MCSTGSEVNRNEKKFSTKINNQLELVPRTLNSFTSNLKRIEKIYGAPIINMGV
jgi:hypothetical protein